MNNSIRFWADLPYPEAAADRHSTSAACLLTQDYAGVGSELTAVCGYFYQSLVVRRCDCELSEIFAGIGNVERHHLQMLGELIIAFGGDPQLKEIGRRGTFCWTSRYVPCCKSIRQMLQMDIESEHKAIEGYSLRLKQLCDEKACAVIERIIADELLHLKLLENCLEKTTLK